MKKELISLVFHATDFAKELNIGDTVLLSHQDGEYFISDGENRYSDYQITQPSTDEIDSLIGFVASKLNAHLIIWDEEYSFHLNDTMVEVKGITKNHIVIVPCDACQKAILQESDEKENECIAEFFGELLEDCCNCAKEYDNSLKTCNVENEKKEETNNMFSELGSSFGKINTNQFRLSINGLAVRGKDGKYVTFNPETHELVEVTTGFFDEMQDLLFIMPATELEVGDIILHQNKPYYITSTREGNVRGIDFEEAVENTLVPKTNVFGMKYYTKVFNCLGTNNVLGDIASNPMMAYALMGGKDFDLSKVMMFQALSGQGSGIADFSENPIMLMALMSNEKGGGEIGDFAKMQILSQLSKGNKKETKPAKETKTN